MEKCGVILLSDKYFAHIAIQARELCRCSVSVVKKNTENALLKQEIQLFKKQLEWFKRKRQQISIH